MRNQDTGLDEAAERKEFWKGIFYGVASFLVGIWLFSPPLRWRAAGVLCILAGILCIAAVFFSKMVREGRLTPEKIAKWEGGLERRLTNPTWRLKTGYTLVTISLSCALFITWQLVRADNSVKLYVLGTLCGLSLFVGVVGMTLIEGGTTINRVGHRLTLGLTLACGCLALLKWVTT